MVSTQSEPELIKSLKTAISDDNHQNVLEICENILLKSPNDSIIKKTKLVSLIFGDKFEEALSFINTEQKIDQKTPVSYQFEEAYCHYRLDSEKEAEKSIKTMDLDNDSAAINLYAQICYKSGDYEKAFGLFAKSRTMSDEQKANLIAAKIKSAEKTEFNDIQSIQNFAVECPGECHDVRLNKALLKLCLLGSAEAAKNILIKAKYEADSQFKEDNDGENFEAKTREIAQLLQICHLFEGDIGNAEIFFSEYADVHKNAPGKPNLTKINLMVGHKSIKPTGKYYQSLRTLKCQKTFVDGQAEAALVNEALIHYFHKNKKGLDLWQNKKSMRFANRSYAESFFGLLRLKPPGSYPQKNESDEIFSVEKTTETELAQTIGKFRVFCQNNGDFGEKDLSNMLNSISIEPIRFSPYVTKLAIKSVSQSQKMTDTEKFEKQKLFCESAIDFWTNRCTDQNIESFSADFSNKKLAEMMFANRQHYLKAIVRKLSLLYISVGAFKNALKTINSFLWVDGDFKRERDFLGVYAKALSYFEPDEALRLAEECGAVVGSTVNDCGFDCDELLSRGVSDKAKVKTFSRKTKENKSETLQKEENDKPQNKKKKHKKIVAQNNLKLDPERWLPMRQRSYYKKKKLRKVKKR